MAAENGYDIRTEHNAKFRDLNESRTSTGRRIKRSIRGYSTTKSLSSSLDSNLRVLVPFNLLLKDRIGRSALLAFSCDPIFPKKKKKIIKIRFATVGLLSFDIAH